jgi:hypothetical protein
MGQGDPAKVERGLQFIRFRPGEFTRGNRLGAGPFGFAPFPLGSEEPN